VQDVASSSQNVKFTVDKMYNKEPIPDTGTGSIFFNCEQQALRYLSMREHNRSELRQKLLTKGYEPDLVDSVLDSLVVDGSLSEVRYIQSFVRSNNKRHPEGKSMLLARLVAKGADKAVAKEVLEEMYDDDYTASLVGVAYEKLASKKAKRGDFDSSERLKSIEIRTRLFKLGFTQSDINLIDLK
jgi:regulatory protein